MNISKFQIGDRVRLLPMGYHGTIIKEVRANNTYEINFDGGDTPWWYYDHQLEMVAPVRPSAFDDLCTKYLELREKDGALYEIQYWKFQTEELHKQNWELSTKYEKQSAAHESMRQAWDRTLANASTEISELSAKYEALSAKHQVLRGTVLEAAFNATAPA